MKDLNYLKGNFFYFYFPASCSTFCSKKSVIQVFKKQWPKFGSQVIGHVISFKTDTILQGSYQVFASFQDCFGISGVQVAQLTEKR